MSNSVFPLSLPGMDINVNRTEIYSTKVQTAVSGKELRSSWWASPRYRYALTLNFVRQSGFSSLTLTDEAAVLTAFFAAHRGSWDSFWLPDTMVQNLIPNGTSEEANPSGYGAGYLTTDGAYAGAKCRLAISPSGSWSFTPFTGMISCTPGENFNHHSVVGGNAATTTARLVSYFFNASGAWLAANPGPTKIGLGWTAQSYASQAPASAAFVVFGIEVSGNAGDSALIDNMLSYRSITAGLSSLPDGVLTQSMISSDGLYMQLHRRVRFDGDELELERLADRVWDGKTISLLSVK